MSHGLEVFNADGHLVMSSAYESFKIVEEGTLTSRTGIYGGPGYISGSALTLPENGLLFAKSSGRLAMVTAKEPSFGLSGDQVGVLAYPSGYVADTQESRLIDYFIAVPYSITDAPATSGYGMEVYNNFGNVVFSTSHPHAAILDVIRVPQTLLHPTHNYANYKVGDYILPFIRPAQSVYVCLNEARPICIYYQQEIFSPYSWYEMHRVPFLEVTTSSSGRTLTIWDSMMIGNIKPNGTPAAERPHDIYPTTRNFLVSIR